MINAPALVLTAAGLSVIARGGIVKPKAGAGPSYGQAETFKFWASILFATGGIILVDRWDSNLATGLASLWLVGGVVVNGPTLSRWLTSFGEGVNLK